MAALEICVSLSTAAEKNPAFAMVLSTQYVVESSCQTRCLALLLLYWNLIVHKGLLCWAPIPTAPKKLAVRTLFLAIDATFSIVLWTM